MLEFNLTDEKLILFSAKAPQVKHMIDYFLTELKKVRGHLCVCGMLPQWLLMFMFAVCTWSLSQTRSLTVLCVTMHCMYTFQRR